MFESFCRIGFLDIPGQCIYLHVLGRWFCAEAHLTDMVDWASSVLPQTKQLYQVLDLFGASGRVAAAWEHAGFNAVGYDIKISQAHDICSRSGFECLVRQGLALLGFDMYDLNVDGGSFYSEVR